MPMYDKRCDNCGSEQIDVWEPIGAPTVECGCGGEMKRAWIAGKANSVSGDECDIWIKHGLCNADGSPRHFRSKSEIKRVALQKGFTNRVEHKGSQGSDKSRHTVKWT